jgi:hypothetical protein
MQKRIMRLGKALVKELGLEPGVDTLSRWMAHYIAEQLAIAKKAKGDAKSRAEQQCFETILKLWQHRSHLPTGMRPFESFDPVFRALERLDPENPTPYFYARQKSSGRVSSEENSDDVQKWLDIARGIDQAARIWLEYVFQQAALCATDENTITWLEHAVEMPDNEDVSVIAHLVEVVYEGKDTDFAEQEAKARQEQLKTWIKQLDVFNNFNQMLRTTLAAELEVMTQNNSSADTVDKDSKS